MKIINKHVFLFALISTVFHLNSKANENLSLYAIEHYDNLINIVQTPTDRKSFKGGFADEGSWMSFTLPQKDKWINGFCGPYDLDNRYWGSNAFIEVGLTPNFQSNAFSSLSTNYYPGEIHLSATRHETEINQQLFFVDKHTAFWQCKTNKTTKLYIRNNGLNNISATITKEHAVFFKTNSAGTYIIRFPENTKLSLEGKNYTAILPRGKEWKATITYLFDTNKVSYENYKNTLNNIFTASEEYTTQHKQKWEGYLRKILRTDMEDAYNRIAVKAMMTLLANWRSAKGDLLHDGVIPSFAMDYFIGFWAWDSWKHAVALSRFAPELAKDQIRAMFDYQQEDGMVIDCIYSNKKENNYRDSKPPLAAWAVNAIYEQTHDIEFIKEMYPKLLKYHQWWYKYRDHDQNGICEFGSVDGTLIAAAWESGMDNAIRFDKAYMLKNRDNAWSTNQESVDLNAYLVYEYKLLQKLAAVASLEFHEKDRTALVKDYFFDTQNGFFYDKKITDDRAFIKVEGCEGYIPFWTKIANQEQAEKAQKYFSNPNKFGTYIPFPTVTADHPDYTPNGYWRGPIWLDQVYFGIRGLRNYGYNALADEYTKRVFDRLNGLRGDAPIHENYETSTGGRLKAPHFSWSAAHLLMLYWETGPINSLETDLCLFQASYRNFAYIKDVTIANLHRTTNYIESNWQDFSSTDIAVLEKDKTYTLETTIANWDSGNNDAYKLSLWIDWNGNYQLEEKELIATKKIPSIGERNKEHTFKYNICAPESVNYNKNLKFRFFLHFVLNDEDKEEPCGWVDSGTAQDFGIRINKGSGFETETKKTLSFIVDQTSREITFESLYPIKDSILYSIDGKIKPSSFKHKTLTLAERTRGIYLLKVSYLKEKHLVKKVFKCVLNTD